LGLVVFGLPLTIPLQGNRGFGIYAKHTVDGLLEAITALGLVTRYGEPLSRAQSHRMLSNPIYCGILGYNGEEYEASHESIVSKKLFDAVQKVIAHRSRPKAPKYKPYLYRGVFRCGECGCFITTETQKGNNYLRCTKRVKKDCSQPYVREESISAQVLNYLRLIALPPEWADPMIQEIEIEQEADTDSRQDCLQSFRSQIAENDHKLDRLMQAYLDKVISLDEYRQAKNELIERKQELKEKLKSAESNRGNWFEPAVRFIKAGKQALFLTENGQESERRDFLRKIGSNLTISNRNLSVEPRKPWQLVVDKGPFAQHNAASVFSDAAFLGEKTRHLNSAEEVRFELTGPLRAHRFSRPAHSTTLPLLLIPHSSIMEFSRVGK
jgi:site-specific DNA recombinase